MQMGATEQGSGQPGWLTAVDQALRTAVGGYAAVTQAQQAKKLADVNIQRAREGQLPLATSMYSPMTYNVMPSNPLSLGLGTNMNVLLLIAAASLGVYLIARRR